MAAPGAVVERARPQFAPGDQTRTALAIQPRTHDGSRRHSFDAGRVCRSSVRNERQGNKGNGLVP